MLKKPSGRSFMVKKMLTIAQPRPQPWTLPPQYEPIVLYLSIVKQAIRNYSRQIKKQDEKQNQQMAYLRQVYTKGMNNTFDVIAPVKKKQEGLREKRQALVEVRNGILDYLKQLKEKLKRIESKQIETFTEMNKSKYVIQSEFALTQVSSDPQAPKLNPDQIQMQGNQAPPTPKYQTLETNRFRRIAANKFKIRLQSELSLFKKFNSSFAKSCNSTEFHGIVNVCLENLTLYRSSLFQLKNCVAGLAEGLVRDNTGCQDRIVHEVKQISKINEQIDQKCRKLAISSEDANSVGVSIMTKLQQITQKYKPYLEQPEPQKKGVVSLKSTHFSKKIDYMIEIVKVVLRIINLGTVIKQHPKLVNTLIHEISEFRYLTRHLIMEIRSLEDHSRYDSMQEEQQCQDKWNRVWINKIQPLKFKINSF